MRSSQGVLGIIILSVLFLFTGCLKESLNPNDELLFGDEFQPLGIYNPEALSSASVVPVLVDPWQSGNAAFECKQAGGCGDFAIKIDEWAGSMDGEYSDGEPNTAAGNIITISSSNSHTFTWTSQYKVCAVIVKGGPRAHIYYYPEGSCGDTELYAPINQSGGNAAISHVSFCFNDAPCNEEIVVCYQEETAWAVGSRYVRRGNWATYTPYPGDGNVVNIMAGQNKLAGTVTFTNNNNGTINLDINLSNTFIFYYDLNNPNKGENVKVQDYGSAPTGNPAPGLFKHKYTANVGSTNYTITVPKNNFYGIHLDVAHVVPCE